MQATLVKWGNSQGVRVPRELCERIGVDVGDRGEIIADIEGRSITIVFEERPSRSRYRRRSTRTLEELAAGWQGGRVGEEWGGADVGAEGVA